MSTQDKYVVRSVSGKRIIGYIGLVFFGLLAIGFTVLVILDKFTKEEINVVVFGYLFFAFMLIISAWTVYGETRPRIVVKNNRLICYPRWKRKTIIDIEDITSRKTDQKINKDSFALGGGVVGYAATKGHYGYSLLDITYYVGARPIINIDTTMKNAVVLDRLILKSIESKETQS